MFSIFNKTKEPKEQELLTAEERLRKRVAEITCFDHLYKKSSTELVKDLKQARFQEGLDTLFNLAKKSILAGPPPYHLVLHYAIHFEQTSDVIEFYCFNHFINVDAVDSCWQRPLHIAAANGNLNAIDILLKHHANPNLQPANKRIITPLAIAIKHKYFAIAKKLLLLTQIDNEIDYEICSLKFAIESGDAEFLKLLLNQYRIFDNHSNLEQRKRILQQAFNSNSGTLDPVLINCINDVITEIIPLISLHKEAETKKAQTTNSLSWLARLFGLQSTYKQPETEMETLKIS